MEILKTIIYGILEGITEWLPISSTGHLILLKELIPLNISAEFWSLFEVVIQIDVSRLERVVLIRSDIVFQCHRERELAEILQTYKIPGQRSKPVDEFNLGYIACQSIDVCRSQRIFA